jgi:ribosome-associated heat shock protein Hsp15
MIPVENIRIDKFLWAVRIFKSRSSASDACRKGRILVNNLPAKPSRTITVNDIITVKKLPVTYTYEITDLLENRIPAKMVNRYIKDITPEEEKAKLLAMSNIRHGFRPRGIGRPTKKERREIDRFFNSTEGT